MADQLFHVVWTTFEAYSIGDQRGNWQKIKDLYSNLEKQQISFQLSEEFPAKYLSKEPRANRVQLSQKAMEQLKKELVELCYPGKDRILDGLKLEMATIHESHVELLVYSDQTSLKQKISRLKSRSATLLSSGKNTWGKGIWIAQIFNHGEQTKSIIITSMADQLSPK